MTPPFLLRPPRREPPLLETGNEADRIATIVKASLRQHYGSESEKLVEFGLQPFRGRARKAKPTVEVPGTPSRAGAPAAPGDDEQ